MNNIMSISNWRNDLLYNIVIQLSRYESKISSNRFFNSPKNSGYDYAMNIYWFHIYFDKHLSPSVLSVLAPPHCNALEIG